MGTKAQEVKAEAVRFYRQREEREVRIAAAQKDLANLESQAGQQCLKLERKSPDSARAWKWIQEHQHEFKNHVYGPPIVECSVKDPAYVNLVESCFGESDLLTFTVQSQDDFNKLHQQLHREMRLSEINITEMAGTMSDFRSPLSAQEMRRNGLDGWLLDYIAGPETVLAAMCAGGPRLHATGVTLHDTSEEQFQLLQNSPVTRWVTRKSIYRITRRREYGPSAVSTSVSDLKQAKFWTDQPVDMTAKRGLQENIDGWTEEIEALGTKIVELKSELPRLQDQCREIDEEKVCSPLLSSPRLEVANTTRRKHSPEKRR